MPQAALAAEEARHIGTTINPSWNEASEVSMKRRRRIPVLQRPAECPLSMSALSNVSRTPVERAVATAMKSQPL